MSRFLLAVVALLFFSFPLAGQVRWSGEAEFAQGQKGDQAYDLYVFGNVKKLDFFGRYFKVENTVHRGEFGLGTTFPLFKDKSKKPRLIVVPYPGITTDKAGLLAIVFVANVAGRSVSYVPDAKFYSGRKTLYQELSVGLTRRGGWQFRWETLDLWRLPVEGGKIPHLRAFNRFGIERRVWTGNSTHLHVSPFFDRAQKNVGFYAGFRWQ